jgi:hypothetical protein
MRRCTSVALTLLGWYLVGPPILAIHTAFPWDVADPDAALSKWTILKSFDAANDCETARSAMLKEHEGQHDAILYEDAVCVATDDPRLRVR